MLTTVGANFKVVQSVIIQMQLKSNCYFKFLQQMIYRTDFYNNMKLSQKQLDGTNDKLISEHMEATLLTSAFTYTGKVIRVKKDDYQQSVAYIKLISIYSNIMQVIDELQQQSRFHSNDDGNL